MESQCGSVYITNQNLCTSAEVIIR